MMEMINYLRAEISKNLKRRYYWGIIITVLAIIALGACAMRQVAGGYSVPLDAAVAIQMGGTTFVFVCYMLFLYVDMTICEEKKFGTFKNIYSTGLSRNRIYISKTITTVLIACIAGIIIMAGAFLETYVILGIVDYTAYMELSKEILKRAGLAAFMWSASISVGVLMATFIDSGNLFTGIYLGVFALSGSLFKILGKCIHPIFKVMREYLLTTQLKHIMNEDVITVQRIQCVIVTGVVYIVVCTGIGLIINRKKDI